MKYRGTFRVYPTDLTVSKVILFYTCKNSVSLSSETDFRSREEAKQSMTSRFQLVLLSMSITVLNACTQTASWHDTVNQGRLALRDGDFKNAQTLLSRGVNEALNDNVSPVVIAPIYLDLGRAESSLKNTDATRAALDAALAAAKSGGEDNEQLIPIYKERWRLNYRRKDFVKAQADAAQALRLERQCCDPKSERLLDSLNMNIAAACAQDRCADTGPLLLEQLEIRREKLGPIHPHVAVSLCLLGELAEKKGQWKEAERRYVEALAIRKRSEPGLVQLTEKNLTRVRAQLEKKSG